MASPSRNPRQSSKWGSFLSQAVAGVESRLDNILTEGEAPPGSSTSTENRRPDRSASRGAAGTRRSEEKRENGLSRTASNSRGQARLQPRLAKAVVKNSNSTLSTESPATTSGVPSRTGSPAAATDSPRTSVDIRVADVDNVEAGDGSGRDVSSVGQSGRAEDTSEQDTEVTGLQPGIHIESTTPEASVTSRQSMESHSSMPSRQSFENSQPGADAQTGSSNMNGSISAYKSEDEYESLLTQLRSDFELSELRRQEEMHSNLERIDALQAKLQYLTKEAAGMAKKSAAAASPGSAEKKLAEKDEQIALLMDEGQKLSKTELKHMSVMKKLRAKQSEDEKAISDAKKKQEKAEKEVSNIQERLQRTEAAEKRANERLKTLSRLERDIESLQSERDSNEALIDSLRSQLEQSTSKIEEAERKSQTNALEAERKLVAELRDDLSSAKIEKELGEERSRAEIRELKEKAERERERTRITEVELKGEQSMLESKVEALRARAEEASSGATGDAQAKLLRQVETLQTQYAVASENWQGIEGSLLTRVTNLEKERDDLAKREGDIRRKAREINLKYKRNEEELESSHRKLQTVEADLAEHQEQLRRLESRASNAETLMKSAREDLEQEKRTWEADLANRIEHEKNKWREEIAALAAQTPTSSFPLSPHYRNESPTGVSSNRKIPHGSATDLLTLQTRNLNKRSFSAENSIGGGGALSSERERPSNRSRQVSTHQPPQSYFQQHHQQQQQQQQQLTPDIISTPPHPTRYDSMSPFAQFPTSGGPPPGTPSIHTTAEDQDSNFESHSSPHRTIADMISVSTVGAGPSVQLVERMSAAVRRLESEKAATKDELTRLSAQRDEARAEVVALMREVEDKRAGDDRIASLEREIGLMNERYQTTLEMLGEKSELVEELRADVSDVKKIYRELVDSTM
ncbi:MAG: hypothetical protein M1837_001375 [Sclerophora amabilis]|nr:MAG: hypothetical protein M1837_001375 [Sclerophora amabilis]